MKKITLLLLLSIVFSLAYASSRFYWWGDLSIAQIWDTSTSIWMNPEDQIIPDLVITTPFVNGKTAVFDESAAAGSDTLKVSSVVQVDSMIVNNTRTYVIRSKTNYKTDSITGNGILLKDGAGTLTLDVKNKLTGGTVLNNGRIYLEKADSVNVFGSKLKIVNGVVSVNTLNNTSPSNYPRIRVPVEIPAGANAKIELGRYSYFPAVVSGDGDLELSTAGDRTMIAAKKDNGAAMPWKDFKGNLTVSKCVSAGVSPGYYSIYLTSNKTFRATSMAMSSLADSVLAKNTVDSTFWNKRVTLKAGAGLTSASGTRCYGIGELQAENDESFLGGYGAGSSTTPLIYWMFGMSNTDVVFPGTIKDVSGSSKNNVGLIKSGTGKYTFTSTKSITTTSLGVLVEQGTFLVNIPVTSPATTTALGRVKTGSALKIRSNAFGGGNGRITGTVTVDSLGTLLIGCDGVGTLELADTLKGTIASPLSVHKFGKVVMKAASKTNHDYLYSNSTITFNGGTLLMKSIPGYSFSNGDTILLMKSKKVNTTLDVINLQTEGFNGLTFKLAVDTIRSTTNTVVTDGSGNPIKSVITGLDSIKTTVTLVECRISAVAQGSGSAVNEISSKVNVNMYPNPAHGNVRFTSSDAQISAIEVLNLQGQLIQRRLCNSNDVTLGIDNLTPGIYYSRIQTNKGTSVEKLIVK